MDKIIQKLREIYSKGILLMPEKMDPAKIKNILIVKNNIAISGRKVFQRVHAKASLRNIG